MRNFQACYMCQCPKHRPLYSPSWLWKEPSLYCYVYCSTHNYWGKQRERLRWGCGMTNRLKSELENTIALLKRQGGRVRRWTKRERIFRNYATMECFHAIFWESYALFTVQQRMYSTWHFRMKLITTKIVISSLKIMYFHKMRRSGIQQIFCWVNVRKAFCVLHPIGIVRSKYIRYIPYYLF